MPVSESQAVCTTLIVERAAEILSPSRYLRRYVQHWPLQIMAN